MNEYIDLMNRISEEREEYTNYFIFIAWDSDLKGKQRQMYMFM